MTRSGEFAISMFMVSDWRVGTGTGVHGYADRLVQREAGGTSESPGAPVIPAKTLIGVWRDSCEVAAHALDGGPEGVWHDWLGYLFGGQYATGTSVLRPAALAVEGPLRLPARLVECLRGTPRVAWAATFRKPGVAIDPTTGSAKAEALRFEEMARAGITLDGRGRIDGFEHLDQAQRDCAVALLDAGARLLEAIGGKRRRGSGRCRMTLNGPDFAPEWAPPSSMEIPAPPATPAHAIADRPASCVRAARTGWERAELIITIDQPVLAAADVLGNLVEGAGDIPGWCLMPEAARRLGGAAHALVRTGDLVVTKATPRSERGAATLPVPRVLTHAKGDRRRVVGNLMADAETPGKPFRNGYVVAEGDEAHAMVSAVTTVRMHNSVRDDVQRPTRDVGGVYVYRALAAGTVLSAEVRVRAGLLEPGWEQKLSGRWRIGRSSKDDYGQVHVTVRPAADVRRSTRGDATLRVWLLSDLLVRDRRLRPSTRIEDVARALEQAMAKAGASGVRLEPVPEGRDGRVSAATGAHRTESWHRGWGLPRPTLYGLAAGSCLTFEVEGGPVGEAVLAEVRAAGVGERRAEGFGQVELNHDLLTCPVGSAESPAGASEQTGAAARSPAGGERTDLADEDDARPVSIAPGEKGHQDARVFERAAWRAEIHRACERIKGDAAQRAKVVPPHVSTTQLNELRRIAREPHGGQVESRLLWLTRSKAGRPGWPAEAVRSLMELFIDPDRIWVLLGLPEEELVVTEDGTPALRAELRAEAVRVLVDSCLSAHARDEAALAAAGGEG